MDIRKIIKKIKSENQGNQYYKVDLHMHTPASSDYKGTVTAEEIVDEAIKQGLEAIAITDHNSVEWCEQVILAAKSKKLTVFPGVEISSSGGKYGLHIIAIFDSNKPIQEIKDCLAKIGLDSKKQGDVESITTESFEKITKEIALSDGIVIGAHSYSSKGIIGGMKGVQKNTYIQDKNFSAIEITNLEDIKYFKGDDPNYKRELACIQSSDSHSLETIGSKFTLLKMAKPNLEGLRQAFCDPQSRIRFDLDKIHDHPSIVGMYVEGGFLDGQVFHFNENMNSLIGGKGTGKTTALELIRFALYSSHKNKDLKKEFGNMVKNILSNGTVYLLVKSKDNQNYLIIRTVGEEPLIYKDDGSQLKIKIDNFHEFFDIECYSQGELICIARDSTNQIKMIDKYIDFETFIEDEKLVLGKLINNARSIIENEELILDLNSKIEKLPSITEKIRIIEEKGLKALSKNQQSWEYEKSIITKFLKVIDDKIIEIKNSKIFQVQELILDAKKITSNKKIKKFQTTFTTARTELSNYNKPLLQSLVTKKEELIQIKQKWRLEYDKELASFKKLCDELKAKDIDIEDYLKLEAEKNKLIQDKEEVETKTTENIVLLKDRTQLLSELKRIRIAISQKRKTEIQEINKKLKDVLHIDLDIEGNKEIYLHWMVDVLKGSHLQKSDTQTLCSKIKPLKLYELIFEKKEDAADILSSKTQIQKTYFEKLLAHQSFITKLFELQLIKLEDSLEIKLNDSGWKKLNNLSIGGKCTAILLIAMLERNTPLMVDQPEDSLDNAFIYSSVVQILRKLKDIRQMIIITHNANIPVLGDCELMFVMRSNGLNGDITIRGVIDNKSIKERVQMILEGGEEAFKKRREKYGI